MWQNPLLCTLLVIVSRGQKQKLVVLSVFREFWKIKEFKKHNVNIEFKITILAKFVFLKKTIEILANEYFLGFIKKSHFFFVYIHTSRSESVVWMNKTEFYKFNFIQTAAFIAYTKFFQAF